MEKMHIDVNLDKIKNKIKIVEKIRYNFFLTETGLYELSSSDARARILRSSSANTRSSSELISSGGVFSRASFLCAR